jgi:O-antigen biosynthesis protein
MSFERTDSEGAIPTFFTIAGASALAVWEGEKVEAKALPQIAGRPLPAPILSLSLATSWGATRVLSAFRRPEDAAEIAFVTAEGTTIAAAPWPARPPRVTAAALLAGLQPAEQVRALRFLLQSCRAAFGLGGHPYFVQLCREAANQLAPVPAAMTAEVAITGELVLCEGRLPARFGRVRDVIVLGQATVRRNGHQPAETADGALRLALEADPLDLELGLVLFGEQSFACRTVDLSRTRTRLLPWLEKTQPSHELREYLASCLARTEGAANQAALREMQLLFPLAKAGVTTKNKPLGGEVELALSHGVGGLYVAGWLHDPHELVEAVTAISATGRRTRLSANWHRFPRPDVGRHYGDADDCRGFASFMPGGAETAISYQHRFELALRSGEVLHLAAPPQAFQASEARNAVLGSIPPTHLSEAALVEAIAPAAASLHARHLAGKTAPSVIDFGRPPARPAVSIIVPLYRVLDFLRFQIAAFAVDPAMADAELIYVLDSPEQKAELEHLLHGLHALYALPIRLLVMPGNYGFAAASNAGATVARGAALLFLNSDVIPTAPGWLPALLGALQADSRLAAVGPKLLFDDGSLQHAGLYFSRDLLGKWYNRHYHKGLPRDFAPACVDRRVPAVTGACLLVRRSLIEELGGFSEDYIIGDYEDSDLCLRLRHAGHEIGYVAKVELFHLERQSIQHHAGYVRGAACAYNRHLHAERWGWLMEELTDRNAGRRRTKRRGKVAA